ncbi:MAG TPA: alkaline phosphatase PhoX [Bryobacteraceae bacterium]|nr:alkaline phosphatase PhoX [Bryobacteraceae bacterium]
MLFKQVTIIPLALMLAAGASASSPGLTPVSEPNHKSPGVAAPNVLSPELVQAPVAQGSWMVENPSELTGFYGYDNDGPMLPAPGALPSASEKIEATKTEPDKNTYLVLNHQTGPDRNYDYGEHFLFQGHENGAGGHGYITRINLDAGQQHRITLMATTDAGGNPLPAFDGSTWYPFSRRLLFTSENGKSGGVWQATLDFPSVVEDISGVFGRAAYEGIQADARGRLILIEDAGGKTGTAYPHARQPNSFVYRFVPYNPSALNLGGKLQVLQVRSHAHPGPIVFGSDADADIMSQDVKDLHTYGLRFQTNWVTIHDTAKQGIAPFDANAAAKAVGGTPFKRPENGQFHPGTYFSEFIFDATGDTDARTEAGSEYGGFGAVFRLRLTGESGMLSLVYRGDVAHTGFDNTAFWSADKIVFVEDAGDTLHTQRNALDSAYLLDLNTDYGNSAHQPVRILAEGRDASATIDSAFLGMAGFQNDGDNEITGWHLSDGDPTVNGLLGASIPRPFEDGWRLFYTQQHGDNTTWEIFRPR